MSERGRGRHGQVPAMLGDEGEGKGREGKICGIHRSYRALRAGGGQVSEGRRLVSER